MESLRKFGFQTVQHVYGPASQDLKRRVVWCVRRDLQFDEFKTIGNGVRKINVHLSTMRINKLRCRGDVVTPPFVLKANRDPFLKLFFDTLGWVFLEYRRYTQDPVLVRIGPAVRLTTWIPILADAIIQLFK
ncbi:MAG: hypothetical protein JWN92_1665 [Candidatus Acidoferrum typicum]|nr:hypothetical protein [Candidatus Acidoferrum typicum]